MRLLRDLKRKVFGHPPPPVHNPSTNLAITLEPELSFNNPLIDYPFNVMTDFLTYVGSFMPVIKELSLHRVRSTVTEAELQNIKHLLPVVGAHLISSGLCYLLLCHQTEQNEEDEAALQGTFILGGLIALGTIRQLSNIIQWGAYAYDNTVGTKYKVKMLIERQFSTFNLSRIRPETLEATCTKDCGTLRAAAHGNFLKSAHYFTNYMAISLANRYIFSLLEPIPYVGPYISTYFYIMAEGRYLLDLGTTYCKEHRTLKPETTLATGLWSYGTKSLLEYALLHLGIPSHTRAIIQEIPLIYFTALVLHINFPTIDKKRPKNLALENSSKATKLLHVMGSNLANPFRAYEETVEWILDAQLIGFSAQIGKLFQGDEEETDWHRIQKKLTKFINHPRVQQAQVWLLPEFLHSCDTLANHPPIREQWTTTRNKLMGYLEKIFAAQHSNLGKLVINLPKQSAKVFQLLLGIKASTAEEIIRKLGDESTTRILKELYWWLKTHGVHQSAELSGLPVLPIISDQIKELSEGRISLRSFKQSQEIPADKTPHSDSQTRKAIISNPPATKIPVEKTVDIAPIQPVVDIPVSGVAFQKKIVDDTAAMALVIKALESPSCIPIPEYVGFALPGETTITASSSDNSASGLTPIILVDTVITPAVTTSKQDNPAPVPEAITKPLTSSNASFFNKGHTRQQSSISLKDFTRKTPVGSPQNPKPADPVKSDSNNFFSDALAISTKPPATTHSLTQ